MGGWMVGGTHVHTRMYTHMHTLQSAPEEALLDGEGERRGEDGRGHRLLLLLVLRGLRCGEIVDAHTSIYHHTTTPDTQPARLTFCSTDTRMDPTPTARESMCCSARSSRSVGASHTRGVPSWFGLVCSFVGWWYV